MAILTLDHQAQLRANWQATQEAEENGKRIDVVPVVKLFTPWASATWLLTEIKPGEGSIAFGLCDLGHGSPELGYASLAEIVALRGPGGLKVERDKHFTAKASLSVYAHAAACAGQIQEDAGSLADSLQWLRDSAKQDNELCIGFLVEAEAV